MGSKAYPRAPNSPMQVTAIINFRPKTGLAGKQPKKQTNFNCYPKVPFGLQQDLDLEALIVFPKLERIQKPDLRQNFQ